MQISYTNFSTKITLYSYSSSKCTCTSEREETRLKDDIVFNKKDNITDETIKSYDTASFPRYNLEVSGSLVHKAILHKKAVDTVEYRLRVCFPS
jgi:hypothetical protein